MTRTCPWEYPLRRLDGTIGVCGAEADWPVKYRSDERVETYCLNHAQREVLGGQAHYYLTMGNQPISWSDDRRISRDGP